MTWHHIAYLISVLVTGFVMVGIALYSRKKRTAVAGAVVYQWIALLVSLVAVFQGISMLGPTDAWALFWFNMRVPCFAVIPVLWLLFVFHYIGKPRLLKNIHIAALLLVPLITEVMLWTSPWHDLWVVRETAFSRAGPFFIPETSMRVPGPFFILHTLYTNLVFLSGLTVLFVMSVRMKRGHRAQAAWLGSGTLLMLVGVLIPTFNLAPGMKLNLLPQGLAVGSLMIAWGVFRHRFLGETLPIDRDKPIPVPLVALFVALTVGIVTAGFANYIQYRDHRRAQAEQQLLSIADLKVEDITRWRRERQSDGDTLRDNAVFNALVRRLAADPAEEAVRWQVYSWLETYQKAYGYDSIFLVDKQGAPLLLVEGTISSIPFHATKYLEQARGSRQAQLNDFHREMPDKPIHLSVIVPLADGSGTGAPFAFVVMTINPASFLFPMIQKWPVPSRSAETLLVRKDDDSVLFLNELRFRKNSALNMRIPLSKTETTAVMAVLGKQGIVEGLDYRGVPVIAALRAVPDSPWFMVARMDVEEVYSPVRERFWYMMVVLLGLIGGAGSGTLLLWRRRDARYVREMLHSAEELIESEEKFSRAFVASPNAITITRPADGKFIDVNDAFTDITGYSREEALTDSSIGLNLWVNAVDRDAVVRDLGEGRKVTGREFSFRKKGGEIITGLFSADFLSLKKERVILSVINDITESKRTKERIRESEDKFRGIFEYSTVGNSLTAPDGRLLQVNRAFADMLGYSIEEMEKIDFARLTHPDDLAESRECVRLLLAGERDRYRMEKRYIHRNGSTVWADVSAALHRNETGVPEYFITSIVNITDRKRAEEKIREKDIEFRKLSDNLPDMIFQFTKKTDGSYYVPISSQGISNIFGCQPEDVADGFDPILRVLHPDDAGRVMCDIEHSAVYFKPFTCEFRVLVPGRPVQWILSRSTPEKLDDGSITWYGFCANITDQRQAEEALHALSSRQEALLGSIPDIVMEVDVNKVYVWANGPGREFFGEDVIGHEAADYFAGEQETYEIVERLFSGDESIIYLESLQRRADGKERLLAWWCRVLKDDDGRVTGALSTARDITEQKRTQEEIERLSAHRQLALSAARMGWWRYDPVTRISTYDSRYCEIFGVTGTSRPNDEILALLDPEDLPRVWSAVEAALDPVDTRPYSIEYRVNRSDGTTVWVEAHGIAEFAGEGDARRAVSFVGTVANITERKNYEHSLRESERKFRETVANLDEGYYSCLLDGTVLEHNRAFNRILGIDEDRDMKGARLPDFWLNPEERGVYLAHLKSAGSIRNYAAVARKANGDAIDVILNSHLVFDETAKPLRIEGTFIDITDRVRMEARFRIAAESMSDVIYEWDLKERIDWFGAIDGLMGYDEGSFPRTMSAWEKIVHPDDTERVRAAIDRLLGGDDGYDIEYRVRKKDGSFAVWNARGEIVRSVAGKPLRWIGAITDITERRSAEDRLRALNEQLRFLVDANIIGVVSADENGRIVEANDYYLDFLGYTRAEFEQDLINWKERTPPEYLAADERAIAELRERGVCSPYEKEYFRKDGTRVWVFLVDAMQADGTILAYALDITARKRAEENIRRVNDVLSCLNRIKEVLLTTGYDDMYTGVLSVVLDALKSEYGVFGYLDEMGALVVPTMTRTVWDRCQVPEKTFTFPKETWGDSSWPRAIREKRIICQNEISALTPQGHVPILRHVSVPVVHRDRAIGLIQVANKKENYTPEDIDLLQSISDAIGPVLDARLRAERQESARRQAEEELRCVNESLEQRVQERTASLEEMNRELESFSYSVSHDLRAPLRSIDGFSQVILEDYRDRLDDTGRDYLGRIRAATDRMARLIDDILKLSRLGRAEMRNQRVDLGGLARSVADGLRKQDPGRSVDIVIGGNLITRGDPSLLRVALENLFGNAWKFTSRRQDARIELGAGDREGEREFYVRDNGVGFEMKYADKLFSPFQRLHGTDEFEGTGIGLALVRRIISRHGGTVRAEGAVGKGATIFFTVGCSD